MKRKGAEARVPISHLSDVHYLSKSLNWAWKCTKRYTTAFCSCVIYLAHQISLLTPIVHVS